MLRPLLLAVLCAALAFAQQPIQVRNLPSTLTGLPLNDIAPGALIAIGPRLDAAGPIGVPSIDLNQPLRVTVKDSAGVERDAPIFNAQSPFSVTARMPMDMPVGSAFVTLHFNGGSSAPDNVRIVPVNFGVFTLPNSSSLAKAQNVASGIAGRNGLTRPVRPGGYFTVWGSGLGTTSPDQVSVTVGGTAATIAYAGPAPGLPGMEQVNVYLPPDRQRTEGCYVPVQILAGSVRSNTVFLALASGDGLCQHPLGLSQAEMQTLDDGGSLQYPNSRSPGILARPSMEQLGSGTASPGRSLLRRASSLLMQMAFISPVVPFDPPTPPALRPMHWVVASSELSAREQASKAASNSICKVRAER